MGAGECFDIAAINAQWGGPQDAGYRMVLGIFADEIEELGSAAARALAAADWPALAAAAHSLRGAAHNVGAAALGEAAGAVELAVRAGTSAPLAALTATMAAACTACARVITMGGPHADGG